MPPPCVRPALLALLLAIAPVALAQDGGPVLRPLPSETIKREGFTFAIPSGWRAKDDLSLEVPQLVLTAPEPKDFPGQIWLLVRRDGSDRSIADAARDSQAFVEKNKPGAGNVRLYTAKDSAGRTRHLVSYEQMQGGELVITWLTTLRGRGDHRLMVAASVAQSARAAHEAALLALLGSVQGEQPEPAPTP
jgi:hypothetical protein